MREAEPIFALIAARAANGVIGRDGGLPWRIPADMRHFRRITLDKPVVMGRKTWTSIGRPLPRRTNIVISRDVGFKADGANVADSLEAAVKLALEAAETLQANEIMVIGGEAVYAGLLPRARRLYLTEIAAEIHGDARFPDFDTSAWQLISSDPGPAEEAVPFPYRFDIWERR